MENISTSSPWLDEPELTMPCAPTILWTETEDEHRNVVPRVDPNTQRYVQSNQPTALADGDDGVDVGQRREPPSATDHWDECPSRARRMECWGLWRGTRGCQSRDEQLTSVLQHSPHQVCPRSTFERHKSAPLSTKHTEKDPTDDGKVSLLGLYTRRHFSAKNLFFFSPGYLAPFSSGKFLNTLPGYAFVETHLSSKYFGTCYNILMSKIFCNTSPSLPQE